MKQWAFILWRVLRRMGPDQLGVIAAGVAFYSLLAVFPAIAALTALAGLFTEADAVVGQLQFFTQYLPDEAALILINQANKVASSSDEGLSLALTLGVAFAIYLSTRATTSLIHGLNIAFQEQESRGLITYWSTVILLTASLLFGVVILALLLIGLPTALAFIPVDVGTEQTLAAARWILVATVVIAGMSILYRWGPSRASAKWKWLTPGTMISSVLWFLGTIGFSIYVANFGNYNQTFGSLGGVIILLTWLWLSAFIVLLGALLDAEVDAEIDAQI
ncbi:MAG: YihY/virulence factor BrkB family protein [Boseongicola sp.]|nr:YihY/virulence factor BrkB family protein [Boseongicola sp.]